jgi:6-phosphogluconate dehydrogenase
MSNRVFIITGVSGCGKTTVGEALAEEFDASFYDGDQFHPASNIAKMSTGIPLTDEDRGPFLKSINLFIREKLPTETIIIACSALKEKYRDILSVGIDPAQLVWIHLQGSFDTIYQRMTKREGHFMGATMLRSQFDTYETPTKGIIVNIGQELGQMIDQIKAEVKSYPG